MSLRDHDVNHGFRAAAAAASKASEKARRYFRFPADRGMRAEFYFPTSANYTVYVATSVSAHQTRRRYREPVKSDLVPIISRPFQVRQNVRPDRLQSRVRVERHTNARLINPRSNSYAVTFYMVAGNTDIKPIQ